MSASLSAPAAIRTALSRCKCIALIGASERHDRDSNHVMSYLLANSYTVVPIAPGSKQILGQTCYASLADVPAELRATIDLVDVFRKSDALPGVWSEVKLHLPNVKLVWLQKGLVYDAGAQDAQSKGVDWVQNKCIMVEHRELFNVPRSLL